MSTPQLGLFPLQVQKLLNSCVNELIVQKLHACNLFHGAFPTVQLLAGQKKSAPFWTFDYYQTFFDVDTYQVNTSLQSRAIG